MVVKTKIYPHVNKKLQFKYKSKKIRAPLFLGIVKIREVDYHIRMNNNLSGKSRILI